MSTDAANTAVVRHLIRLIQDSPDVRYYVGGPLTTMRDLLIQSIKASGHEGDPLDLLRPAPHHSHERSLVEKLREDVDRLEDGIDRIREALAAGDDERAAAIVARLQEGGR
jgi:hypothetical protein